MDELWRNFELPQLTSELIGIHCLTTYNNSKATEMSNARFSLRLEPDLKDWLEQEAKRKDRSAGYVAIEALQNYKHATEAKREMIEAAMLEADQGKFVSEEAMTKWFLSLGTENELPEPDEDVFVRRA
jgi:predicted transcriptional regulator